MGKGTIVSGGTAGLYNVQVNYLRTRYLAMIAQLNADIAQITTDLPAIQSSIDAKEAEMNALAAQIAIYESDKVTYKDQYCAAIKSMSTLLSSYYALQNKKNVVTLKQKSKEVRLAYLSGNMPADPELPAWCADLTENLTGEVGTIEVPGERGTVMIQPGHEGNASYDADRDGQLQPAIAATSAASFYNLAMLPGWQKWKPTYRFGTITSLNLAAVEGDPDYCDVALDAALSSRQSLDVNQATELMNVPIEYMTCNGAAFEIDDEVVVQFDDQDWTKPRVIGFKDNPKSCNPLVMFTVSFIPLAGETLSKKVSIVWDPRLDNVSKEPVDYDNPDFQTWYLSKSSVSMTELLNGLGVCGSQTNSWDPWPTLRTTITPPANCPVGSCPVATYDNGGSSIIDDGYTAYALTHSLYGLDAAGLVYPISMLLGTAITGTVVPVICFRTSRVMARTGAQTSRGGTDAMIWTDTFNGPLGPMGTFSGTRNTNVDADESGRGTFIEQKAFIPTWETNYLTYAGAIVQPPTIGAPVRYDFWSIYGRPPGLYTQGAVWTSDDQKRNKRYFEYSLQGKYNRYVLTNVCAVQYIPWTFNGTVIRSQDPDGGDDILTGSRTFAAGARTIHVQSQALYDEYGAGWAGINYTQRGANSTLEAQIKASIEMAYTLNAIPADEIRRLTIDITVIQ